MSRVKKFGLSRDLNRGFSETIKVVENHASKYHNTVIPISRIELDPNNPRNLLLTLDDLQQDLNAADPDFVKKQIELANLKELAQTIKNNGLINPIAVYKLGDKYRLIAGERRTLATVIAGGSEIEARVFSEKPKALELKLVQWAENNAREDLTLSERVINIRDILTLYAKTTDVQKITAAVLSNLTGLQASQAANYLSILRAAPDVLDAVINGSISNLDKAVVVAGIKGERFRIQAISMATSGASLTSLKSFAKQENTKTKELKQATVSKLLKLGSTKHPSVVKVLVDAVLADPRFQKFTTQFATTNWQSKVDVAQSFMKLIKILEKEV